MFDQQTFPTIPADEGRSFADEIQHFITTLTNAVNELSSIIKPILVRAVNFCRRVVEGARQIARDYDKGALLKIYRARATWKKGDVKNLEGYPHRNASAQRRIQRLRSFPTAGRPTVKRHIPLVKMVLAKLQNTAQLCAPNLLPHERLARLKQSMWWLYFVDALYRGEYLRRQGTSNPSRFAEEVVAEELCISRDHLHRLRLSYRNSSGKAPSDNGFSLHEFEIWKLTGNLPN